MSSVLKTRVNDFTPIADNILVTELEEGMQRTRGGIILTDDNFKDHGIRPRWARVWKIGPEVDYVKPGEWVLVEHGRWTLRTTLDIAEQGEVDVWKIDPAAILVVATEGECPALNQHYAL